MHPCENVRYSPVTSRQLLIGSSVDLHHRRIALAKERDHTKARQRYEQLDTIMLVRSNHVPQRQRAMALLSATVFQLPLPPFVYVLPPHHFTQWLLRAALLIYVIFIAVPLILVLAPISVVLQSIPIKLVHRLAPLPVHVDNLPPNRSLLTALERAIGIYIVSAAAWAITSSGCAPDTAETRTSKVVRATLNTIEYVCPSENKLELVEVILPPAPNEVCVGVLGIKEAKCVERTAYWLQRKSTDLSSDGSLDDAPSKDRQAILFLAGGGYVTGATLSHPFVYTLLRSLPSIRNPGGYSLLAPCVRKSLDLSRAFPAPLLDAIAGYCYLRKQGYKAGDITLLGDSAGGGLCWSLLSTMVILEQDGVGDWGVPGRVALISPWLSLPPCPDAGYPDLVNKPMLLNAARCYLARFPIQKHRPDPFGSVLPVWAASVTRHGRTVWQRITNVKSCLSKTAVDDVEAHGSGSNSQAVLQPDDDAVNQQMGSLSGWLDPSTFTRMTSHHPLISPATDPESPFVKSIFAAMSEHQIKLMVYAGTAEWFHEPVMSFAKAAAAADVKLDVVVERGGFHSESCILPGEWGAASGRFVRTLLEWLARGL